MIGRWINIYFDTLEERYRIEGPFMDESAARKDVATYADEVHVDTILIEFHDKQQEGK